MTTFLADWGGSTLAAISIVCLFRKSLWYWYAGLGANVLWFMLFVQTSSLMVAGLQISYAVFAVYGVARWRRESRDRTLSAAWDHVGTGLAAGVLALTAGATAFSGWQSWLEFSAVALSIAANWMTAMKIVWCWPVWMLTNILFAALYLDLELWGLFTMQFVFAGLSVIGLVAWLRERPELVHARAHA